MMCAVHTEASASGRCPDCFWTFFIYALRRFESRIQIWSIKMRVSFRGVDRFSFSVWNLKMNGKKDEPIIISDSDDGNFFLTTLLRQVTKFFPEQIWNPALYAPYLGQFLQVNIIRTELSNHVPTRMMFWTEFTVTQCSRVRNLSTRLYQHPSQMLLSNGVQI